MVITCHQIAQVGDELAALGDEPSQRSAVSRHFYAAFHRCVQWKDALPGTASIGGYSGGSHQTLLNQLRGPDRLCSDAQKKRSRFLAVKLAALRTRRVVADYELGDTLLPGEVNTQQFQAATILADCDANP